MNTAWTAQQIPSQQGRRVLITGANSGIGFEAALELARHGAEIILPARTEAKADAAIARIRAQVPSAKLIPEILDLADLRSVHSFAQRVVEMFPGRSLDLLINNAGVMAVPTRDSPPTATSASSPPTTSDPSPSPLCSSGPSNPSPARASLR